MLKKTITYTDYNGVERTEDFYFNLSKHELMKKELGIVGGFSEMVKKIIDAKEGHKLIAIFEQLVLDAYGVKSEDGKRFIKNAELKEEFSQTEAYDILYMELATNTEKAIEFINGIVPAELSKQMEGKSVAELTASITN